MTSLPEAGLSLAAGALTTLSPCVFPLLPLVLGGALQGHRAAPLAMGAGMAGAFALLGLLVGVAGDALGLDPSSVRVAGAWLFVTFGLVMLVPALNRRFTAWMSPLASRADQAASGLDRRSLLGAFGLGTLLGLVWSPCSGPLLGATLTLVASEGGAARGTLLLALFGLGAATPLVLAAYASRAGFGKARGWVLAHAEALRHGFALLMLAMGIAILTGGDKWLETLVNERLPDAWVQLTTRI
jgi:cytochrome c biogenesis protein CcdA